MVSFLSLAALVLLPTVLAQLMVNTPASVVECQPTQFSWSGGTSPYFVSLLPGGQPTAPPVKQFPTQSGTSLTWKVDIASGTPLTASVKDAAGSQQYSSIFTIQSSGDSSCVNSSVVESGGVAAVSTAATSIATSASSGTKSASSGTPSATGSAASSSSTKASDASINRGSALAVAGVMGLVGAVLF